mgnify:CR=1 FL=1
MSRAKLPSARLLSIILILLAVSSFAMGPHWVFFADKGFERGSISEAEALKLARDRLSRKSLERRALVLSEEIVDYTDIRVAPEYVRILTETGAEIRVISRSLNAASVEAEPDVLTAISELPFVREIRPVARFHREEPPGSFAAPPSEGDYGNSFNQNDMIGVPRLHRLGIDGDGVLVCITDTGFRLDHHAFDSTEVIGKYDFVDDDSVVTYQVGDPSISESHGTKTWSVCGGFDRGQLIAPAYRSTYLLARTEHYTMEDPVEEDYWIAAAEWADSAGARVISVSLGYDDWYTPDSMTGDIAPITCAADIMASRGICVLAAAGNNGAGITTITAPSDGDSVFAVGAVGPYGNIASFSSRGPSADGRIKPDLAVQGGGTWSANYSGASLYAPANGTSLSTPLLAGLVAALLEARPGLSPMGMMRALKETATRFDSPDNDYGWGIPDGMAALSVPVGGECVIPVFAGWNLLSLPFDNSVSADSAFPGRLGEVWLWDPDSAAYRSVSSVEPGSAYFVLYPRDTLLAAAGDSLEGYSRPVSPGWNGVAGVRGALEMGDIGAASTAELLGAAYRYDTLGGEYVETNLLMPGRGYFVLVMESGNLRINE